MKLQSIHSILVLVMASTASVFGQDWATPTRLTFDPAQDGFPTWSSDGTFLLHSCFSWKDSVGRNGIWKIPLDGKQSTQVFSGIAEHPQLSPDGRLIVFDSDTGASMSMIDANGGTPKKFLPDSVAIRNGGLPIWSPAGSQIAFKDASGFLCVYDMNSGKVAAIFHEEGSVPLPGCWSKDGKYVLYALMNRQTRASTMWKISVDGKEREQITGHREGFYRYLALSPDGTMLAYAAMEGRNLGLWVMPAQGGESLPLAITRPGHNESPAWSPDGTRLAFTSTRSGNFDIWLMDLDVQRLQHELQSVNK